jgi:hypothetical protein
LAALKAPWPKLIVPSAAPCPRISLKLNSVTSSDWSHRPGRFPPPELCRAAASTAAVAAHLAAALSFPALV